MMIYESYGILVREIEQKDELLLVSWLSNPRVLQYYEGRDRPHNLEMVRESFFVDDEECRCIVEYHGKPIGYIQFYQLDADTMNDYGYYNSAEKVYGMDQFIGETAYWNQGIGTKLIKSMVDYLSRHKGADKIVMDPQTWNERALACYAKCGFKKVKLMKEHEKHEGIYRDCWLIQYSNNDG